MRTVFPWQVENELKAEFFGPLQTGFFVEVGANQPQQGSQSWQFEQAGWRGVLVEPQPDLAERLRQSRRAHVVAAACSSPANAGTAMTLHVLGRTLRSIANSPSPASWRNRRSRFRCGRWTKFSNRPARRCRSILCRSTSRVTRSRYCPVSIWRAGARGFFWSKTMSPVSPRTASLTRAGYRLIRRTGPNGWYVPQDRSAARRSWLVADCAQILSCAADPHVAGSQTPAARPAPATARRSARSPRFERATNRERRGADFRHRHDL